jgi:hypothetical protein
MKSIDVLERHAVWEITSARQDLIRGLDPFIEVRRDVKSLRGKVIGREQVLLVGNRDLKAREQVESGNLVELLKPSHHVPSPTGSRIYRRLSHDVSRNGTRSSAACLDESVVERVSEWEARRLST